MKKEKDMGDAQIVPVEEAPTVDDRLKVAPEQIEAIKAALKERGVEMAAFLAKADIEDITELAADDAPGAIVWIRKQGEKSKSKATI